MAIRTGLPSSVTTPLSFVHKIRATTMTVSASGLKPNSKYTLWCNGTDMSWACRTPGTRQGTGLMSDSTGSITVYFSMEITPEVGSSGSIKYNSIELKDMNGDVHGVTLAQQTLIGKTY